MKNKNKGYMFTNSRHSKKAIVSTIFGTLCLFFLVLIMILSYRAGGEVPTGFAFTGLFSLCFSVVGMYLGVVSVKEIDRFKIFGWIGIVLNGLTLCLISLILYMGSYQF